MKQKEIQQRTKKILTKLKLKPDSGQGLEEAQTILKDFLKERRMKCTPERDYILDTIYHLDGPFDVDSLHEFVCQEKAYICRVTVYNNLLLFVDAGVVARFQPFPEGALFFEKCIGQLPHGYQVCRKCGAIRKLKLDQVIEPLAEQLPATFKPAQYCLYILGLCGSCANEVRHEIKLKQLAAKLDKELKEKEKLNLPKSRARKRYTSIKEVKRDQALQALRDKTKKNNN